MKKKDKITGPIPTCLAKRVKQGYLITRSGYVPYLWRYGVFDICRTVLGGPVKAKLPPVLKKRCKRDFNRDRQDVEYMVVPGGFLLLLIKYANMIIESGSPTPVAGLTLQEFLMKSWGN